MQQINQMIADVDKDGSGAIDYEFEHMMTAKIGERDSKDQLSKTFHIINQDKNVRNHLSINPLTQSFFGYCTESNVCQQHLYFQIGRPHTRQ
jgi:Ca2+-binding EF-hand superfamily protein